MVRVEHIGRADLSDGRLLALTDYYAAGSGVSNLICYGSEGNTSWEAELRDPRMGQYVAFEIDGGRIFAQSFDCYRVELDRSTGKILSQTFTK